MTLLGAILQRAAEGRRIAYNPQRVVRKARLPIDAEVRPLAPITVERMRAGASPRDAAILSVLFYAGLRPGELGLLRWRRAAADPPRDRGEDGRAPSVRLLTPRADDLAAWRTASAEPPEDVLLFPDERGHQWSANGFEKWCQRRFADLLKRAGLSSGRPYDLRQSFASLLLHEGRDVIYVARQLGHGAELTLRTYGHVIEELEDSPQLPAEEAIRLARQELRERGVYPSCTSRPEDGGAGADETRGVIECPELDSNQRPTP
jgi:integrase